MTAISPTQPWWFDVVKGHAKALTAGAGTFFVTLGNAAADGHLTLAEVLLSVGAALGVGGGVSRVANTGPRAPGAA